MQNIGETNCPFIKRRLIWLKKKYKRKLSIYCKKELMLLKLKHKKIVTEDKIEELDKKLEDLPNVREELV